MVKSGDAAQAGVGDGDGMEHPTADFKEPLYGRVNEKQQARYAASVLSRADEWPWMGAMMYWFFKRADDREGNPSFYYFRMFEPDFTPMPVYASVKEYTPTARFVDKGFKSTTHWAMDWRGAWDLVRDDRAYFGEYKPSGGAGESGKLGDSVSFNWRRTDLDLVVMQNPYGGAVRVQIDNDAPREIELWRTDSALVGALHLRGTWTTASIAFR